MRPKATTKSMKRTSSLFFVRLSLITLLFVSIAVTISVSTAVFPRLIKACYAVLSIATNKIGHL
jgi:hypothetical protein